MARTKATEGASEAVRRVRALARTEGIEAAYGVALAVCRNTQARPADQLDAANLICRMGGVFEGAGEEADEKPLHTMSRAELVARANQARAILVELDDEAAAGADSPDVFD